MCVTRGEVERLYLKIGDMIATMPLNPRNAKSTYGGA
jgi:hypothetical protein